MTEHTLPRSEEGQGCDCQENRRFRTSRRALLTAAGATALAAPLIANTQLAFAGPSYSGDTVVVLSLRGGFDGLSAVAPVGDPLYAAARPTIGVPSSRAIKLDQLFGLHPALAPLKSWWDRGSFAVVHAVGQQDPTRSHFKAMQEMENAAPGSNLRTGWLDRMVGLTQPEVFSAIAWGTSLPQSMFGPAPEVALKSLDSFTLAGGFNDDELKRMSTALRGMYSSAPATLSDPVGTTLTALDKAAKLRQTTYSPAASAHYPDSDLGTSLRDVARLIKSGVGLRAATIDIGNWDMHVGLGVVDKGWMFKQLTDLAQSLDAFATDLGSRLDDVTLITLSEFGRRVSENASGGLDHGHGNVCLILGGGLKTAGVFGRWPGLAAGNLVNGDLAGTTDYRTILAELLEKRTGLSAAQVFPKLGGDRLGLFQSRG